MLSEISEEKAKIMFVIIVAFFIVVLLVVSYFIYFDETDEKNNEEINNKINNIKTIVDNDILNKKPEDNKPVKPVRQNEPLNNIKNDTYKNQKGKQVFNISNNLFTYSLLVVVLSLYI